MFWKLFLCSFLIIGCVTEKGQFVVKPQKSSYIKEIKEGIELNGCFYATYQRANEIKSTLNYYFFYENGVAVFYNAGQIDRDSVIDKEYLKRTIKRDLAFKTDFFKTREGGGVSIEGDKINIQVFRFVPSPTWGLCTLKGKVISDSLIYISSCEMDKRPDYCQSEFYLHFMEMSKPDSVNQLMKKKWYWKQD